MLKKMNLKVKTEELKKNITSLFPELWKETEVALSSYASMRLKEFNDPQTIVFTGAASSGKSTILSFFYPLDEYKAKIIWECSFCDSKYPEEKPKQCDDCRNKTFKNKYTESLWPFFKSDNFTPRSFVTHAANIKEEKLSEIDMLPKILDKVLISPELAPIFGKSKEDLIENFSILARILDGEGFESDSGSRGHRGYTGNQRFCWFGATTPLSKTAWNIMSDIGHRILFVKMDSLKKEIEDYERIFLDEKPYSEKIEEIRKSIKGFIEESLCTELYTIEWDRTKDREVFKKIIRVALLVRLLRAKMTIWQEKDQEGGTIYQHATPMPEEPERLISALYNIARGRAVLYNRKQLTEEDLTVVYRVALSSMPFDRCDFFLKLIKLKGTMTTEQAETELKCSKATARQIMMSLEKLGVCAAAYADLTNNTKKMEAITLQEQFSWVLEDKKMLELFEELREAEKRAIAEDKEQKKENKSKKELVCHVCGVKLKNGEFVWVDNKTYCSSCAPVE